MPICSVQSTVQVEPGKEVSQECDASAVLLDQQGFLQERITDANRQSSWHGMFPNTPNTATIHCMLVSTLLPGHRSHGAHLGCSVMNIIPSTPATIPAQESYKTNIMLLLTNMVNSARVDTKNDIILVTVLA